MGSNGLTSARHDVFSNEYEKISKTYDNNYQDLIYSGSKKFTDSVDGVELTLVNWFCHPQNISAILDKIFIKLVEIY